MPVIPAGQLEDGTALTGLEAAILISVDEWAKENSDWFKYRSILNGGLIFSLIVIFAGFFTTFIISIIGILSVITIFTLIKMAKPTSMKFPKFAASIHNLVDWKGKYHFITKNEKYFAHLNVREALTNRFKHVPSNYPSINEWESGDKEHYSLSLNSLMSFVEAEKQNFQQISTGNIFNYQAKILLQPSSLQIVEKIIPNFSDAHFGEDVSYHATEVDTIETNEVKTLFSWLDSTITHNMNSISHSINEINNELEPYLKWAIDVRNRCERLASISFDSTQLGWDNSLIGLFDAEKSLELSVAADIISQEETVKREMESAEAKLREKKADFELEVAETQERLSRKIIETDGMISAQKTTLDNVQSIPVSPTITLQNKYGDTYGGGGHISASGGSVSGVSTTVRTDYYDITNPAYTTLSGLEKIATGDLNRYKQMKNSLTTELEELGGSFQRRVEQMKKQQDLRLEEIEIAKQRAINAIRKDSREVISIQNIGGSEEFNPWVDLKNRNLNIWNRPFDIIHGNLAKYKAILAYYENFEQEIVNEATTIESILKSNTVGPNQIQKIVHHWVVLGNTIYSEIIPMSKRKVDKISKIQIEMGSTKDIFGVISSDLSPLDISSKNLESCIYSLVKRNAISPEVFNSIKKFDSITIGGGLQ